GWNVKQDGGTAPGAGSVTVEGTDAVLREGNSFDVTLSKSFVVPDRPSVVSFMFSNLAFDTLATGQIKDAFEAALVDGAGNPLVHRMGAGRDAFFNITEGVPAALGAEASEEGQTVTLSLAGVTPGTMATLVLRLVNNDSDTGTSVHITCANFPPTG